jgi:hypothetical protein
VNKFIGLVVLLCAFAVGFASIPGCPKATTKDKDKAGTTDKDKMTPADKDKATPPAADKDKSKMPPAADKDKDKVPPPAADKMVPPPATDKDKTPPAADKGKDKVPPPAADKDKDKKDKATGPDKSGLELRLPEVAINSLFNARERLV